MSLPVSQDPVPFRRTATADLRFISASQFASMELSNLSSKSLSLSASKTLRELMHKTAAEDDDDKFELSIPPREPRFVLAFSNLTYSVRIRGKMSLPIPNFHKNVDRNDSNTKVLLNDISGVAREGEIMAVLGASGSGKSTLIDALADRIESSSLKGTITLNDDVLDSKLSKLISAYVMQDDLLFPMLSVEETLMYSAEFRLPRSVTKSKKKERVAALISQLGLQNAAKTMIGDEGRRGVSGGERRRVSIGIDIIHDPIVLFLDEPTSGLDSTSAYMVVKVLQRIAKSGSVVIMSIHQPSYRILDLLDQTIFLSRGKTVYSGSPSNLSNFLSEFGHPVPENENRTEFTLDLIREMEDTIDGTNRLVEFNKSWNDKNPNKNKLRTGAKLTLKEAISQSISKGKLVSGAANSDSTNPASFIPTFANPMWMDMFIISDRSMRNARRIPEMFTTRLGAIVITGLILATMFWKLDDSPRGVQERIGFMAFAMSTTFYTCAEAIPTFLQERYIFMRETAYNAYRRSSYVVAQTITTFPTLVLLSLTFTIITFPSIGLSGGFSGFIFFFLTILSAFWVGNSFVTFLSGIISHEMIGFAVVIANLSYFLLFSGFFITRDRIPTYWLWFHYASLIKYPFEAIVQNEFDDPLKCFVTGFQMFDSTPLVKASVEVKERILSNWSVTLGGNVTGSSCVTTGHDVLVQRGVLDINKWDCLLVCVGLGFFFRILFYWALMFGSKNKRG